MDSPNRPPRNEAAIAAALAEARAKAEQQLRAAERLLDEARRLEEQLRLEAQEVAALQSSRPLEDGAGASPEPAVPAGPSDRPPARRRAVDPRILAAVGALGAVAVALVAVQAQGGPVINVCSTSLTDRLVNELVAAYTADSGHPHARLNVGAAGDRVCDVRFWSQPTGRSGLAIARDGLVVVVNPENPIGRIGRSELRAIFSGQTKDWKGVGGPAGGIVPVLPDRASDEGLAAGHELFAGTHLAADVRRMSSTADVVRFVASPEGARAIGVVAFSGATPAKVIALGDDPPPSPLAIAERRYPLGVDVLVESDFRSPSQPAEALLHFARSAGAQPVIVRSGLVGTAR